MATTASMREVKEIADDLKKPFSSIKGITNSKPGFSTYRALSHQVDSWVYQYSNSNDKGVEEYIKLFRSGVAREKENYSKTLKETMDNFKNEIDFVVQNVAQNLIKEINIIENSLTPNQPAGGVGQSAPVINSSNAIELLNVRIQSIQCLIKLNLISLSEENKEKIKAIKIELKSLKTLIIYCHNLLNPGGITGPMGNGFNLDVFINEVESYKSDFKTLKKKAPSLIPHHNLRLSYIKLIDLYFNFSFSDDFFFLLEKCRNDANQIYGGLGFPVVFHAFLTKFEYGGRGLKSIILSPNEKEFVNKYFTNGCSNAFEQLDCYTGLFSVFLEKFAESPNNRSESALKIFHRIIKQKNSRETFEYKSFMKKNDDGLIPPNSKCSDAITKWIDYRSRDDVYFVNFHDQFDSYSSTPNLVQLPRKNPGIPLTTLKSLRVVSDHLLVKHCTEWVTLINNLADPICCNDKPHMPPDVLLDLDVEMVSQYCDGVVKGHLNSPAVFDCVESMIGYLNYPNEHKDKEAMIRLIITYLKKCKTSETYMKILAAKEVN